MWQKKKDKQPRHLGFGDRLFEETMGEYEARTADRCEIEAQTNFQGEKSVFENIIIEAGHEVIFYPKLHCELKYIEYYWAALKRYTRANCQYSFSKSEDLGA